jgi:hypothetical protein
MNPLRIRPVRPVQRRGPIYNPGPDCETCGMKRINVVHEQDPEHSAEGPEYHANFAHHPFLLGYPGATGWRRP